MKDQITVAAMECLAPVGKRYDWNGTHLQKTYLKRTRGSAFVGKFTSFAEYIAWRESLGPTWMLFCGTWRPDVSAGAKVIFKKQLERMRAQQIEDSLLPPEQTDVVAATNEFLEMSPSATILRIDTDVWDRTKDGPCSTDSPPRFYSHEEYRDALITAVPQLSGLQMAILDSSSSNIFRNGNELRGAGGFRCEIPIAKGTDIKTMLEAIHQRLWLAGLGYVCIDKAGRNQEKSPVDLNLRHPAQPDFARVDLGPGIESRRQITKLLDGDYLVDAEELTLNPEEFSQYEELVANARAKVAPQRNEIVERVRERRKNRLLLSGKSSHEIERTVSAYDSGVLLETSTITLVDGSEVSVGELLEKGDAYNGECCLDPLEEEYDGYRPVAKFFWNDGLSPGIHSFAHGSSWYALRYDDNATLQLLEADSLASDSIFVRRLHLGHAVSETARHSLIKAGARKYRGSMSSIKRDIEKLREAARDRLPTPDRRGRPRLDQPIDSSWFPVTAWKDSRNAVVEHIDNIEYLLEVYGFDISYDVIEKRLNWSHPELDASGDNAEETFFSKVLSLCSLNSIPTKHITTHLVALADKYSVNPIVEYLDRLDWDRKTRFKKLASTLVDDPGAEDLALAALSIFLKQSVAAADHANLAQAINPNVHPSFEYVLVLCSEQGIGKTKGFRNLLPRELRRFYQESVILNTSNKDTVRQAVSCWIAELGELEATMGVSSVVNLKAFLSKSQDTQRLPYARGDSSFKRRTVFVGSVNSFDFLKDITGNRRYVPLMPNTLEHGWSDEEIDQLWAEAWYRYLHGEQWWPNDEEQSLLREVAEEYRQTNYVEELIYEKYNWELGYAVSGSRKTIKEICMENGIDRQSMGRGDQSAMSTTIRKLWREHSSDTQRPVDHVSVREDLGQSGGEYRKIYSPGGANRGYILPPVRTLDLVDA